MIRIMEDRCSPKRPRAGTGTVFINNDVLEDGTAYWMASWQSGRSVYSCEADSREEAMTWARSLRARRRMIFEAHLDDYVDFD